MNDERLRQFLRAADEAITPAPEFAAGLLQALRGELGFAAAVPAIPARARVRVRLAPRRRSRAVELLLVAALLVAAALGLAIASGALRVQLPAFQRDALTQIQLLGRIRIAIRPDHPQFSTAGQPAAGFDTDVAQEIGKHMGLTSVLVIVPADAMRIDGSGIPWDVGLPSSASWLLDRSLFELSSAYYHWPHRVLVTDGSPATVLGDLSGPICAVTGDAGAAWLEGRGGASQVSAVPVTVITRATDNDCLAALSDGSAAAAITAHLSDADIAVRPGIRVLDPGPDPDERVAIVPRRNRADGPSPLLVAIDAALESMHADGTLARLSENRFGGADLTEP